MLTVILQNVFFLNAAAVLLFLIAWKQPRMAKLIFAILFSSSAIINLVYAAFSLGGTHSWLQSYIHLVSFPYQERWVLVLFSVLQLWVALSLILRGWVYISGVLAGIIILGAIVPLGSSMVFPSSFIMAFALTRLLRFNHHYFWYVPRRIWA